ncbi:hypothetical protein DL96DRAFT_1774434 [Flagelloscypha sp. PMI_526]|nr:hypothetical protein DL96DRAFT_1774434 [Flagelloscypha sp. PMI_526]
MTEPQTNSTSIADTTPHSTFNSLDADLSIVSRDNILFKIHWNNLRVCSAAFPQGQEPWADGNDPAHWDEPSDVLEVLFSYIYPDRNFPHLLNFDLTRVLAIGSAAHKWMMPAAIVVCQMRVMSSLREIISKQPTEEESILISLKYLAEHHGEDPDTAIVIDEAAMWTIGCRADVVMKHMGSGRVYNAWADHRLRWLDASYLWDRIPLGWTHAREIAARMLQDSRSGNFPEFLNAAESPETAIPIPRFTVSLARF